MTIEEIAELGANEALKKRGYLTNNYNTESDGYIYCYDAISIEDAVKLFMLGFKKGKENNED